MHFIQDQQKSTFYKIKILFYVPLTEKWKEDKNWCKWWWEISNQIAITHGKQHFEKIAFKDFTCKFHIVILMIVFLHILLFSQNFMRNTMQYCFVCKWKNYMENVHVFGGHCTFPQNFPAPYPSTFSSWLVFDLFLLGRDVSIGFWSVFFSSLVSIPYSDIPSRISWCRELSMNPLLCSKTLMWKANKAVWAPWNCFQAFFSTVCYGRINFYSAFSLSNIVIEE